MGNYERDRGCLPWEVSLMTRVYSCEEDVEYDGLSLLGLHLYLYSLSISLEVPRFLGLLGASWRSRVRAFPLEIGD